MLAQLPYEAQESVNAILAMAQMATENAERISANQAIELLQLKSEIRKNAMKDAQIEKAQEIYKERILMLEGKLKSTQDSFNAQKKAQMQNKRAVQITNSTNKNLLDSLEALQASGIADKGNTEDQSSWRDFDSPMQAFGDGCIDESPLSPKQTPSKKGQSGGKTASAQEQEELITNGKLRRSLLLVTRERSKFLKKSESMEHAVHELRKALTASESKVRDLKIELEEYRSVPDGEDEKEKIEQITTEQSLANPTKIMRSLLQTLSDRFLEVMKQPNFDATEILLTLKKFIEVNSCFPVSLVEEEIILHFLQNNLQKLFNCEFLNVFVLQADDVMIKYDSREGPQAFLLGEKNQLSIAAEVLRTGKPIRINNTRYQIQSHFFLYVMH